ncbi:hypothetical protein [Kribbella sp.]|uniref:hypothetical protein n=1 Tax=Kribbella sp. TaxID=1871183 RepID=UPI002D4B42F4|nr:hypothetical protein [Kribbella sp.]HZX08970.1 hypothetical protein [Kribbella sp.]
MPDTDDDLSVELDPVQREQGDDDTEAARERRAAKARAQADKFPTHDLDDEARTKLDELDEQTRLDAEDLAARAEEIELATKDEQTLEEHRLRNEDLATAEASRAMRLAYADEQAADVHRQYAANDKQRGIGDCAHGRHELDEAAVRPDDPGSAGLAAEGRRFQNLATYEERRSAAEDQIADDFEASAHGHRDDAREAQPHASGAVRNPPEEAPEAQLPQDRLHVRGHGQVRDKQGKALKPNPSRAGTPDLNLDRRRDR